MSISFDLGEVNCAEAIIPTEVFSNNALSDDIFMAPLPPKSVSPGYAVTNSLSGHNSSVTSVKFRPDGEQLASGSADSLLKLWDINTAKLQLSLCGHKVGINDVAWSHGHLLASCSDDKTIRLWDQRIDKCQKTMEGHKYWVFSCRFHPTENLMASCSYDETIRLWDIRTCRSVQVIHAHHDPISTLDFNLDGSLLATGSYDGLIRIWDTASGTLLKTLIGDYYTPVAYVKFSPNGEYLLASTLNSTLNLWNFQQGKCRRSYGGHVNEEFCMNFSVMDDMWIVSGSEDQSVCIWKLLTKELVQKTDTIGNHVLCTDSHPSANMIATGVLQNDFAVKLWQCSEGESS